MRAPARQSDGPLGEPGSLPRPVLQDPSFLCSVSPPASSDFTLLGFCSSLAFLLTSLVSIFYIIPYTWYLYLLQNLVRMLWGLRFFPNQSFPASKYYEGGQIISNYNLQKTRENLPNKQNGGKQPTEIFAGKSNILFFFKAIKSCKHTNKCILIRVKLLVNEFALGFCIFGIKIYKCFY